MMSLTDKLGATMPRVVVVALVASAPFATNAMRRCCRPVAKLIALSLTAENLDPLPGSVPIGASNPIVLSAAGSLAVTLVPMSSSDVASSTCTSSAYMTKSVPAPVESVTFNLSVVIIVSVPVLDADASNAPFRYKRISKVVALVIV